MEFDGFDRDAGNREKCQRHGVALEQIESLFRGQVLVGPDPRHSQTEQCFRAMGRTAAGRPVFVVFTWRIRSSRRLIRPISARCMHGKEIAAYEEKVP